MLYLYYIYLKEKDALHYDVYIPVDDEKVHNPWKVGQVSAECEVALRLHEEERRGVAQAA